MIVSLIKNNLNKLSGNRQGAISVEFALLAPVFATAILFSANLAFKIVNHQKLAAAVNTSATYLQDQVAQDGGTSLGKQSFNEEGIQVDNKIKRTAKIIVEESFGKSFNGNDARVVFYCACPPPMSEDGEINFNEQPFYTTSAIQMGKGADVCPSTCESVGGEQQRIIAKISVTYQGYDLFGRKQDYSEEITTRLR